MCPRSHVVLLLASLHSSVNVIKNMAERLLPCPARILWKKNEVADYEATTFSIFYNNTLFLVLVIVASFFLLKNFNPTVYPSILSVQSSGRLPCFDESNESVRSFIFVQQLPG